MQRVSANPRSHHHVALQNMLRNLFLVICGSRTNGGYHITF